METFNTFSEGTAGQGLTIFDIDRTLYNIQYKSGKFFADLGDRMIYDIFSIQFMVYAEAIQKK